MKRIKPIIAIALSALTACGNKNRSDAITSATTQVQTTIPAFNADSAYKFVAEQVAFGPRVPGSEAHSKCHDYIAEKLRNYGANVEETDTVFPNVEGNNIFVRNISAAFNPNAQKRVLIAAHYDSRPWADQDSDKNAHNTPIDGANDGASGVGVILEIARLASSLPKNIGLELLLVDAEDSGSYGGDNATWCIGSQAWAANRKPSDKPISYGILLDMVGGKNAVFHREYFSESYAPEINQRVWQTAKKHGYGHRFADMVGGALNDDHIYLMRAGFPVIDIVECNHPQTGSFNPTWHTLDDNLQNIDKETLGIVGEVVLKTITN